MVPDTNPSNEDEPHTINPTVGDLVEVTYTDGRTTIYRLWNVEHNVGRDVFNLENENGEEVYPTLIVPDGEEAYVSFEADVESIQIITDTTENDDAGADNIWVAASDDGAQLMTDGGVDVADPSRFDLNETDNADLQVMMHVADTTTVQGWEVLYDGEGMGAVKHSNRVWVGSNGDVKRFEAHLIEREDEFDNGDIVTNIDEFKETEYIETIEELREVTGGKSIVIDDEDNSDDKQTVYIVVRDLDENKHSIGGAVAGVYTNKDAADAHVEDINDAPWELAEVQARPLKDAFKKSRLVTDGGDDD